MSCDGCKFHSEYWDEIDGEMYDDGCYCENEEAIFEVDGTTEDWHFSCCTDKECPCFDEE